MTTIDWIIAGFILAMALWGYQQGLIVGALSLAGFFGGALIGSRLAPELLREGSRSPYAPLMALLGALLVGGAVAILLEGLAYGVRGRLVRGSATGLLDGLGGAALTGAVGLALAWLGGAVALHTPGASGLRRDVQRSEILRRLNELLPPAGPIIKALNRIDPFPRVEGPEAGVRAPPPAIARDPQVRAAGAAVVRVLGTACGLGVEGSGWVAAPGLVVTNAHVVAGQDDTAVQAHGAGARLPAVAVHFDSRNDLAVLRAAVGGLAPLRLATDPARGTAAAILGYPENGPYRVTPARLGATETAISQDAYGRGPLQRRMTTIRGRIRSGNSGGPAVDGAGRVLATVFAATDGRPAGGFGVPNEVVERALDRIDGPVGTGPCTR